MKVTSVERRSARAAMLSELYGELTALWCPRRKRGHGREIDMDRAVELRSELARRFAALPIDQRRTLVKALLSVTVYNGRGLGRVDVLHVGHEALDVIERTDEV